MTYNVVDIPENLKDTVDEWRQNLVESVAEYDDNLLEKFFDDPDSITKGRNDGCNSKGSH